MEENKIARINYLAKKSKGEGLSDSEKEEQIVLRREYIESFKSNLKQTLDSIVIVESDGTKTILKKDD